MILDDDSINDLINQYNQEHKALKKTLIQQAIWGKEHISLAEIYSLPYQERSIVSDVIKSYYDEINKKIK